MKRTRIVSTLSVLVILLVEGCSTSPRPAVTPRIRPTSSMPTETAFAAPDASWTRTPLSVQPTLTSTSWLAAFSQVTQAPVSSFWWSDEGPYLHFEARDHLRRYDAVTGEIQDITPEAPVYGQPSVSVLRLIPDEIPASRVYFAPSGRGAVFAGETSYYGDITPSAQSAGELGPSRIASAIWYVVEEQPEAHWLGVVDGVVSGATWSRDEANILLEIACEPPLPPGNSLGWLLTPREGRMWNLFSVAPGEVILFSTRRSQIALDGQSVFFYTCVRDLVEGEYNCDYWLRVLDGGETYHDESLPIPTSSPSAWLLPNSKGVLVSDGIVLYLYALDTGSWIQLNDTDPPYTWHSVPMDPIWGTSGVEFSSDSRYIAWNGSRGLQVFSLCPGGGELLDCE
jgi:hypothetical protein